MFDYIYNNILSLTLPSQLVYVLSGSLATLFGKSLLDYWKAKKQTIETKKRLARALNAELKTLLFIYDKSKLDQWDDTKPVQTKIAKIDFNYLIVFESNTDKLGLFDSDEIDEIVKFYTFLKSFIETLQVLAMRWEEYARYSRVSHPNIPHELYLQEKQFLYIDVKSVHEEVFKLQDEIINIYLYKIEPLLKKYY